MHLDDNFSSSNNSKKDQGLSALKSFYLTLHFATFFLFTSKTPKNVE